MPIPPNDERLFQQIARDAAAPSEAAPPELKADLLSALSFRQNEDAAFHALAACELTDPAPRSLKSRVYSALVQKQNEEGPLLALPAVKASGSRLCVFEELVRITPVGPALQSFNYCRVCHARLLAERLDPAPIWWPGCPYVRFQSR